MYILDHCEACISTYIDRPYIFRKKILTLIVNLTYFCFERQALLVVFTYYRDSIEREKDKKEPQKIFDSAQKRAQKIIRPDVQNLCIERGLSFMR